MPVDRRTTVSTKEGRRQRPRRFVIAVPVAGLLAAFAGLAVVAGANDQPAAQTVSNVDVTEIDVPSGKLPVASHEGDVAGFIDAQAADAPDGYPPVDLGSGRRPVHALDVTDHDGRVVGYFVEGLGFVDSATAEDDAAVDALLADAESRLAELRPPEADSVREALTATGE